MQECRYNETKVQMIWRLQVLSTSARCDCRRAGDGRAVDRTAAYTRFKVGMLLQINRSWHT